jgi:hypothetical protein
MSLSCEHCGAAGGGCIVCQPSNRRLEDIAVVRTWDRDGSQNIMRLPAAVDNIAGNLGRGDESTANEIRQLLLLGRVVETELASFRVPGLNGG